MKILFISIIYFSSFCFFINNCSDDSSESNIPIGCTFSITGYINNTFSGDLFIYNGGSKIVYCDTYADNFMEYNDSGLPINKPLLFILVNMVDYNGPGTYTIPNLQDIFYIDSETYYKTDMNSENCKITYTTDTSGTFQCSILEDQSNPSNIINIVNGKFGY